MECAQTPESWQFVSESKVYCFQGKAICIPVVYRPTKSLNSKHKLDHRWWEKLNQLRKEIQSVCHVYTMLIWMLIFNVYNLFDKSKECVFIYVT